jgi:uncharacterized protein (UPF0276 family)
MKFAINYSTQAAGLFAAGKIPLDLFKSPDWPDLIVEAGAYRPVAVHFSLKARRGKLFKTDWEQVDAMLEQTGTPYVNLHLDPGTRDYPGSLPEVDDPVLAERVVDAILADVHTAVKRYGPERVIVENVPYRAEQGEVLRPAVETENICRIVAETGCGLLLDISHARITAHHLGLDAHAYMNSLPVHRLKELHFTGLHNLNGRLQDHLEALPSDWPELEWVLERIRGGEWTRPWMLAFEYGGVGEKFAFRSDAEAIATQVPRLYEMVKNI